VRCEKYPLWYSPLTADREAEKRNEYWVAVDCSRREHVERCDVCNGWHVVMVDG
jgi:hypothetical protein